MEVFVEELQGVVRKLTKALEKEKKKLSEILAELEPVKKRLQEIETLLLSITREIKENEARIRDIKNHLKRIMQKTLEAETDREIEMLERDRQRLLKELEERKKLVSLAYVEGGGGWSGSCVLDDLLKCFI